MERLPDLRIPRVLGEFRIGRYAKKSIAAIPRAENLCVVEVATRARLTKDMKKAGWTARQAAEAAMEQAVSALNHTAEPYGWTFFLPKMETNGSLYIDREVPSEMGVSLEALLEEIRRKNGDPADRNMLYEIGAKGRAEFFRDSARYPRELIVGVRNLAQPAQAVLQDRTA